MIEFQIEYSLDTEIERVTKTIERLPWYREQGYGEFHNQIPKQLSETSTPEEIRGVLSKEFIEEKYKDYSEHIKKHWFEITNNLEKLKEIPDFQLKDKYIISLTKYGSGGSYNPQEGRIIVNINFRSKDKIAGTIIHEAIHIGIQHLINKYNVKHWDKERLVDLIGGKYFPGLRQMQNISENISAVDKAFAISFPDIDTITKAIGKF